MLYECEILNEKSVKNINELFDVAPVRQGLVSKRGKNDIDETQKKSFAMEQTSSQFRKSLDIVNTALQDSNDFSATYMFKDITVPIFSEYREGGFYDKHIDDIKIAGLTTHHSISLFLNSPDEYEGGQLVVKFGDQEYGYKCKAGTALIYPTGLLHHVEPVTSGRRRVALMWGTSIIRESFLRYQLIDLSNSIIKGIKEMPDNDEVFLPFEQIRANFMREYGDL